MTEESFFNVFTAGIKKHLAHPLKSRGAVRRKDLSCSVQLYFNIFLAENDRPSPKRFTSSELMYKKFCSLIYDRGLISSWSNRKREWSRAIICIYSFCRSTYYAYCYTSFFNTFKNKFSKIKKETIVIPIRVEPKT